MRLRVIAAVAALFAAFAVSTAGAGVAEQEAPAGPGQEICKDGGWELIGYRNQGECVSSFVSNRHYH